MPIGLDVNNPQSQQPIAAVSPVLGALNVTYGGNALGSGASTATTATATGAPTTSSILIYGAVGLFIIFIFQRLEN